MKSISFSELKIYNKCGWKHKLQYVDKVVGPQKTQYTAFGIALHKTEEHYQTKTLGDLTIEQFFLTELEKCFNEITDLDCFKKKTKEQEIEEMKPQGLRLLEQLHPELDRVFPGYAFVAAEEKLEIPLESGLLSEPYQFKGYIDFIIALPNDTICILDYKTTSWGWTPQQKNDKMTTYQLTYYKHFYGLKYGIKPEDIKIYFVLLKRTVKKEPIEIFEVGCGPKKISNSLELLNNTMKLIDKKVHIKNRNSCHEVNGNFKNTCPFWKTKWCT